MSLFALIAHVYTVTADKAGLRDEEASSDLADLALLFPIDNLDHVVGQGLSALRGTFEFFVLGGDASQLQLSRDELLRAVALSGFRLGNLALQGGKRE